MNTTPVRPVQRSEPAASPGAGRRAADSAAEPRPHPSTPAASREAFEQALQRLAGKPCGPGKSHTGAGAEAEVEDADQQYVGTADMANAAGTEAAATALPTPPSMPLPLPQAVASALPLRAAAPAPTWSACAPQPLDAVSRQLNALQVAPASRVRSEWQLQLLDRSLPVQQLDIQRGAAGGLRVVLSASPETARSAPLERLRQRLVARGSAPESLRFRQPREELDS